MAGEDELTLETDAALAAILMEPITRAFPRAQTRLAGGPLQESLLPSDAIQWAFAGTMAFFTITGGVQPAYAQLRALVHVLTEAYRSGRAEGHELVPTLISYRGGEITVDVSTSDPDVAVEALRLMLEK